MTPLRSCCFFVAHSSMDANVRAHFLYSAGGIETSHLLDIIQLD